MNMQNTQSIDDQTGEQLQQSEPAVTQPAVKKLFVEPTVSVPADVLEATTFFQTPTIEGTTT